MTIDEADENVMPLTPRILNGTHSIADDEVDTYNALQARLARSYLIHWPSATFTAATIANWRTRTAHFK